MLTLSTIQKIMTAFTANHETNWKDSFEAFKKRVHTKGRHIFVQEIPQHKMVQLTYMHP